MAKEPEPLGGYGRPPRRKKSLADKAVVAALIFFGGVGCMAAAGSLTLMWHAYLWFQGRCM